MKSDNLTPAMASEANKSSVSIPSVIAIPPTPVSGLETEANDYMVPETPVVAVSTASGRHETIVPSIGKGDQLLSPTVADDAASTTSSHHSHFRSPSASHILGKLKKKRSRSESISSQKSDASEFFYEATNEKLLDDLQVHYAHLGKHVRDVRIVSPPPEAPKLKAFQSIDENGKTTTRWGDYARVVSKYTCIDKFIEVLRSPILFTATTTCHRCRSQQSGRRCGSAVFAIKDPQQHRASLHRNRATASMGSMAA